MGQAYVNLKAETKNAENIEQKLHKKSALNIRCSFGPVCCYALCDTAMFWLWGHAGG